MDGSFIDNNLDGALKPSSNDSREELSDVLFFIDVFRNCSILSRQDCEAFLTRNFSLHIEPGMAAQYLGVTPAADVLHRTLNNVLRDNAGSTGVLDYLRQEDTRVGLKTPPGIARPVWATTYLYVSLQIEAMTAAVARTTASSTAAATARLPGERQRLMEFCRRRVSAVSLGLSTEGIEGANYSNVFQKIFMATMLKDVRSDLSALSRHLNPQFRAVLQARLEQDDVAFTKQFFAVGC
jgi:hypothetical protein